MNALWTWPIKRLYFCPFSSPKIGKLFNDSSLSSTRQTKGSTSSKSSAFGSVFTPSATKMPETRNKMPAASVYLLEKAHLLPFFVADSRRDDSIMLRGGMFIWLIYNDANAQNVFVFTFKCILVGCFIISSLCIFLTKGASPWWLDNMAIYMLCRSYVVFFDDMGLQAGFFRKKIIRIEERYHIYSWYFIFLSSDFHIYNV